MGASEARDQDAIQSGVRGRAILTLGRYKRQFDLPEAYRNGTLGIVEAYSKS